MRVSVVVPCYDAAAYVRQTLTSILDQELPTGWELEVVAVDDGSTDGTGAILDGLAGDGVVVLRQRNSGNVAARNVGLEHATGDLVAFCDADDVWYPGKLVAQIEAMRGGAAACCVAVRYLDVDGRTLATKGERLGSQDVERLLLADFTMPVPLSGWMFSRASGVVLLDESLPVGADFDLAHRVASRGAVVHVARPLVGYRIHPGSITASRLRLQQLVRRFVMARQAGDPSANHGFEAWRSEHRPSATERLSDFSARQVRLGANDWSSGSRPRSSLRFAAAAVSSPAETWRKARRLVVRRRP